MARTTKARPPEAEPARADACDVVIVGGGLTGPTLAVALAKAGFRVALCDGEDLSTRLAPEYDGRSSAIAAGNMRLWRALGIGAELAPLACPIRTILVTDGPAPGASAAAPLPVFLKFDQEDMRGEPDEPMGWMLENRHIRMALARAVEAAGVAVFAPDAATGVEFTPTCVCVTLTSGAVLRAPLVIGAEGRRSVVRQAAGVSTFGFDYKQSGVVATVALEHDHQNIAHEYFLPGGPFAILPLNGQRASLVWSEETRRAKALVDCSAPAFEAHLSRRFGEVLGQPRLLGHRMAFPLSMQIAERMVGPRFALVGDAAHGVHPIAGQGLNMGLKDVAALAEVMVEARKLGEDWSGEIVLERYARWRRFDVAGLAVATDVFTRAFSSDNPLLRAARGIGLAAVNRLAPARRLFVREAAGLLGDTPKLLRGEAL